MEKSKRRKVRLGHPEKRTRTKDDDEDDWDMALNTYLGGIPRAAVVCSSMRRSAWIKPSRRPIRRTSFAVLYWKQSPHFPARANRESLPALLVNTTRVEF